MIRSLYISYFGVREPLVQNQVLPYLRELVRGGVHVSLLTFEPDADVRWSAKEVSDQKAELLAEGIHWDYRKYHKRLSLISTTFDVLVGAAYARRHVAAHGTDIIHARVHMPAAMGVIAKKLCFKKKPKVLFDIRGFLPEEYTDAGVWKENGFVYRVVKRVEKWLLRNSDGFVVLTERAREILFPESKDSGLDDRGRPVAVIPCCVDLERQAGTDAEGRRAMRARVGADGKFVVAYVGSFGGWYLTEETLDFFGALKSRRPDAFALILTQSAQAPIREGLQERGYSAEEMLITKVSPAEVSAYLDAADAAVSFIKPCYSKIASSPTKFAEYLAAGLPVVLNAGIGDTAEVVTDDSVGVVIDGFETKDFEDAFAALDMLLADPETRARCRSSARSRFALAHFGGPSYLELYRRLMSGEGFR